MKKTFHIITIGCQMNKSDSERIAFYLESYGFKSVADWHKAGIIIVVTCGIRQTAEDRNYGFFPKFKKENPRALTVLTGCLSKRKDVKKRLNKNVDVWLSIDDLPSLHKHLGIGAKKFRGEYLDIEPNIKSSFSAFIPIGNGCNNFCSYCVVPHARGREKYRKASNIIREMKKMIKEGYKEIILIAQNVNSYRDPQDGSNFPELLKRAAKIPGNFWVRFASSHPKDMSDDLIKVVAESSKLCNHFHFAVQAGDNEILRMMNRKYTVEQYKEKVKKIRQIIPDVSISTDTIVGFPSETKKQFANTVKLYKEMNYDMAYIARFSPRPGTVAARMKDNVSPTEKRRREEVLTDILKKGSFQNNRKFLNKKIRVLIEGKKRSGLWFGRSEQDKIVILEASAKMKGLDGNFVLVNIKDVDDFALKGSVI